MKTFVFAGAALAVLGASAAIAHPSAGPRNTQPITRAAVEARVDAGFTRVDADRDGFITQAEARAVAEARRGEMRGARHAQRGEHRARRFAQLDTNHDGVISRAEFDARPALRGDRADPRGMRGGGGQSGGMFARFGGAMFGQADGNRDGRVSREEARAGALALFARIDTDRDGTISMEERRAARETMRAQRQQRRQG